MTDKTERFSAEYAAGKNRGGLRDKQIFLYGPSAMINALIKQFLGLGVPGVRIIVEDFNLV